MSEVKQIFLHGNLKKQFGEKFKLAVQTPVEAVKAMCHLLPGFKDEFVKYDYHVIKGQLTNGWILDDETVKMQIANDNEVHFIPSVAGSGGGGGLGKLITGVVLIGLAFTGVGAALAGSLGMGLGQLKLVGAVLALGGLAEMNAKTPKFKMSSMEPAERRQSFTFNGAANTTEQGNAIPLIYGRLRVGSQVAAQGMDTADI